MKVIIPAAMDYTAARTQAELDTVLEGRSTERRPPKVLMVGEPLGFTREHERKYAARCTFSFNSRPVFGRCE